MNQAHDDEVRLGPDQRGELAPSAVAEKSKDEAVTLDALLGRPRTHQVQMPDGGWLTLQVWPPTLMRMRLIDEARSRLTIELMQAAGGGEAWEQVRPGRRWWNRWQETKRSSRSMAASMGRMDTLADVLAIGAMVNPEALWRYTATVLDPRMDVATQEELLADTSKCALSFETFLLLPKHVVEAILADASELADVRPLVKKALDLPEAAGSVGRLGR